MAPEMEVNRVPDVESFGDLLQSHRDFLAERGMSDERLIAEIPDELPEQMEHETQVQIRHNLDHGLIETDAENPETVRYSWRGLFFLYGQLVKDMVKLS